MPRQAQNKTPVNDVDLDIDLDTPEKPKKPRAKRRSLTELQKRKIAAYKKLLEHAKPCEARLLENAIAMVRMNK